MRTRSLASALALALALAFAFAFTVAFTFAPSLSAAEPTDKPVAEPIASVLPSPAAATRLPLGPGERVVDFEISPHGGEAAILVKKDAAFRLVFWKLAERNAQTAWEAPSGFTPRSVTWHPVSRALFLLGGHGAGAQIVELSERGGAWQTRVVLSSPLALRRLCVGPRPFTAYDEKGNGKTRYRLFYGSPLPGGGYSLRSVSELGDADMQVVGPGSSISPAPEDVSPSGLTAASALPLGFHPAGHLLLWEDGRKSSHVAAYDRVAWGGSKPLFGGKLSGGTVTALPNGMGVVHWRPGSPGVDVVIDRGRTVLPALPSIKLTSSPSLTPDGKGLVGLTDAGGRHILRYEPLDVPLGDVANAWMFAEDERDRALLEKSGGLFRALSSEQLYALYDTESYHCGGYDAGTPTRPYLVTTDLFWELFAAAYEGLFIIRERQQAVPAFWAFLDGATSALPKQGRWAGAFAAASALRSGKTDPEAARIRALKAATSSVLGEPFDFGDAAPRGHYTASPEQRAYFMAFRYLTEVGKRMPEASLAELKTLPADVRKEAVSWLQAYEPFLAAPRGPLVFRDGFTPPPYLRRPLEKPALFPLAWGFDNETLLTTVFHRDWPEAEQIKGPAGPRLLPSGLDVAAALGSRLARTLLANDLAAYPRLASALDSLAARAPRRAEGTLYDRWIDALAVQWAEEVISEVAPSGRELWRAKRLQTGLASWATLRHATVLVNERTAAECGEGGFEEIVLEPPRGAVEPDPRTFEAIAGLLDEAARTAAAMPLAGKLEDEPLRQGILKRLAEASEKTRLFARLAAKQKGGAPLTPAEYEEIQFVGRVAEHDLLVFKSLANPDLGLAVPDPMSKVVDIAGGGDLPYLLAGVGLPLEWDFIVPHLGRRQLVKGAVYSYYELTRPAPMDDAAWRAALPKQPRPAWIAPFLSPSAASCPAKSPY